MGSAKTSNQIGHLHLSLLLPGSDSSLKTQVLLYCKKYDSQKHIFVKDIVLLTSVCRTWMRFTAEKDSLTLCDFVEMYYYLQMYSSEFVVIQNFLQARIQNDTLDPVWYNM